MNDLFLERVEENSGKSLSIKIQPGIFPVFSLPIKIKKSLNKIQMSLETVKVFQNPMDAHILKATLESRGINCYLFDEHIVSTNALYSNMVGGIKLKVGIQDVAVVREILEEIDQTPYTDESDQAICCPKCQSTNLESGKIKTTGIWPKIVAFISLVFGTYPVSVSRVYRCKDCDMEFK